VIGGGGRGGSDYFWGGDRGKENTHVAPRGRSVQSRVLVERGECAKKGRDLQGHMSSTSGGKRKYKEAEWLQRTKQPPEEILNSRGGHSRKIKQEIYEKTCCQGTAVTVGKRESKEGADKAEADGL